MKTTLIAGMGLSLITLMPRVAPADWDYHGHRDGGRHDGGSRDHGWERGAIGVGSFIAGLALGSIFAAPPREHVRVVVAGNPYYYCDGVYYRPCPQGYVVVNPPYGAVVPVIPSGATVVVVQGRTYYWVNGAYYLAQPEGYAVVPPPPSAPPIAVTSAPVAPAPVAAPRSGFAQLGHDWAADVRNDVVTWDQFVDWARTHLIKAGTAEVGEFREAFIAAYGMNGRAAFERALKQARGD